MKVLSSLAAVAAVLITLFEGVQGHTRVYSVYVNGVDTGTFNGIRVPAYSGPPPAGYANGPIRDLDSIDMRCNTLGDHQVPYTIQVRPSDNITLEWRYLERRAGDQIIPGAPTHLGPVMVYLSPDPPTEDSFVKIYENGKYAQGVGTGSLKAQGKWATYHDLVLNKRGMLDIRVPKDLKAGFYLLRAELVALALADVSWKENESRGAQFFIECIQLEIIGDGDVELPKGVSFPGAYKWDDPGVLYDIPGPTVWSGAWAETPTVTLGKMIGPTAATSWDTWIIDSVVTSASAGQVLGSSTYQAQWSTIYHTPTPAPTM